VVGNVGGTIVLIACLLLVLLNEVRALMSFGRGWARKKPALWAPLGRAVLACLRLLVLTLGRTARIAARLVSQTASVAVRAGRGAAAAWASRRDASRRAPPEPVVLRPIERPSQAPREAAGQPGEGAEPIIQPAVPPRPRATEPKRAQPKPRPAAPEGTVPIEQAVLPPLSLLTSGGDGKATFSEEKLRAWSDVLEGKLKNYGIEGRVTAVIQGPLVTTFEFEPAPGVRIREIVSRSDDLALAMKALSLRLIAPIPGRSVVGIEIPNPEQEIVYLRDVLKEIPDRLRLSGIMIGLGVDVNGKPFYMNLCGAPHLLMAGTTGSGKSVSLNCFLASMLFQYHPSDLRLILVDPKMVEMSAYNGIPHLLHPVITDPRDAVRVFTYLIAEMERRNELFRKNGVKNIESYNSKVALGKAAPEVAEGKLSYIVLVVDELGDLVLTKGADIESLLSRLSNMARAVGIHMIVATQRPSVDVIVGKTKANFPTRIAFRVASKVDSRTILDCVGAEKLIGKGDLLLADAKHAEPIRLHGAWISEDEMEKLVAHWKQYEFEESRLDLYDVKAGVANDLETDPLFEDAREIVLRYRQGSTSLLQRKLHVGYARAARLLDQLEQAGIVGPPDGSKPREVLVEEGTKVGYASEDDAV
jgi:S-DNA-T family DNA segregation ATPase FtsK/SpoIIIE